MQVTKVLAMDMTDVQHYIRLKFDITLEWVEYRATFYHLIDDTKLNTLTDANINSIWLPLLNYDNTDDTESTRLGVTWEWSTDVLVKKSGEGVLDINAEKNVFRGKENYLQMKQSYSHSFHCEYVFHNYPFDTQVSS